MQLNGKCKNQISANVLLLHPDPREPKKKIFVDPDPKHCFLQDKEYSLDHLYSLSELTQRFQLDRIHTASCRIELDRLAAMNQVALRAALATVDGRRHLINNVKEFLNFCEADEKKEMVSDERIEQVLVWAQDRLTNVRELASKDYDYVWRAPQHLDGAISITPDQLKAIRDILQSVDCLADFPRRIKAWCRDSEEGLRYPQVMKDLRLILSGRAEGRPLAEMLDILHRDEAVLRIDNYLKSLEIQS